eukprot:jgi/Tetstr1/443228/TSEL_031266.t1
MSYNRDRSGGVGGLRSSGGGLGGASSPAGSRHSPAGSPARGVGGVPAAAATAAARASPNTPGSVRRTSTGGVSPAGKPTGVSPAGRRPSIGSPSLQSRLAAGASPAASPASRSYSRSFSGPTSSPDVRRVSSSSSPSPAKSSSATASPTAGSPPGDINARRRRLSQTYGGAAPDPRDLVSPAPTPQTIHENMRELGFSVLTTSTGMDTDRSTQVGRCKMTYSCATHPGNDPGGFQKDNQDAWVVKENFGNQRGIFFGVFDGHGYEGRKVSHAIVNRLPKMLASSEAFKAGNFKEAASKTCVECNAVLKRLHTVNSDLSGSTGIMAYIHADGKRLTVVNVGDSRCIIGKVVPGGSTEGVPLSTDHVPTIASEAARIRQFRGRIASFMHMGRPVGPLRVWLQDRDIPGLCMTRSFGDNVAASVGVISKPEITEVVLKAEDKYLILMSDGLTEFIGNDEMIAMVHKHAQKGLTPHEISNRLVKESRKRWKAEEDDVVDDCTIIVVFLERTLSGDAEGPASSSPSTASKTSGLSSRSAYRSSVA